MHNPVTPRYKKNWLSCFVVQISFAALFCCTILSSEAQNCPPNIDFETGTFSGWTCYTGSVAAVNGANVFSLSQSGGPMQDRHTMYSAGSGELDPYGNFPVNCPNGSGHSIKLGNNMGGGEAEGVSYEFTIPANKNEYSLIYNYAVVFQDPNHLEFQQPRMEIEIKNITDDDIISCSSFSFFPYGSLLPGFYVSGNPGNDGTPVWCKNWSAVSINLDGLAGKTIRLLFRTGDCTFRRHFGYAYLDVNSECSSEFVGATYCKDDSLVNVTAPYGYQSYTWYNSNFSQVLGNRQTLTFYPPPPSGTLVAVEIVPYNGYGCLDTLYARLVDTLTVTANAGPDVGFCTSPVLIGANSKPGLVYSWSPATGLSNATLSNPVANPDATTRYILTTRHDGGGCMDTDTMLVRSVPIDKSLELVGRDSYCIGSGDSALLRVRATDSIQWFRDGVAIPGAQKTEYKVNQPGLYHAMLFNNAGCNVATVPKKILIDKPRQGMRYPDHYAVVNIVSALQARLIGDTVVWSPALNLSNSSIFNPLFIGTTDQFYTITIKTKTGCTTVDTLLVKVIKRADIYVPTAFTPNNDGRNDLLKPVLAGIKELRYFRVYNRWGQLIYETRSAQGGWDGNIKGRKQATDVVVWIAEGLGEDGKVYARKGTCVLVR